MVDKDMGERACEWKKDEQMIITKSVCVCVGVCGLAPVHLLVVINYPGVFA